MNLVSVTFGTLVVVWSSQDKYSGCQLHIRYPLMELLYPPHGACLYPIVAKEFYREFGPKMNRIFKLPSHW
jgi:hypothetical protein